MNTQTNTSEVKSQNKNLHSAKMFAAGAITALFSTFGYEFISDVSHNMQMQDKVLTLDGDCSGTTLNLALTTNTAKINGVALSDGCHLK